MYYHDKLLNYLIKKYKFIDEEYLEPLSPRDIKSVSDFYLYKQKVK